MPDHYSLGVYQNLLDQEPDNALTLLNRGTRSGIAQSGEEAVKIFSQLKVNFLLGTTSVKGLQTRTQARLFLSEIRHAAA